MMALGVTEDDLDANRHGYMSKLQRAKLRGRRWQIVIQRGQFAALIIFVATAFVMVLLPDVTNQAIDVRTPWLFAAFLAIALYGVLSSILSAIKGLQQI